ncbi:MAG: hypothetical protein Q8R86_05570, partial [Sulfuricurvum sp.]|nr:hypothetical protein [Sulfuricurvum sp.]
LKGSHFQCPKCGEFHIEVLLRKLFDKRSDLQKVSHWLSEQNKVFNEKLPEITEDKVEYILQQRDKTIREKFNAMMRTISKFAIDSPITLEQINECYIIDNKEFQKLLDKAVKDNLLQDNQQLNYLPGKGTLFWKGLTFEGHEFIESLDEPNKNSNKIFMAFWFDPEIQKIFDDIVKPAIDEVGFLAERVSSSTTSLENKISDEIIGMIKSSRAVIADCTGNRTAVYYEAGYAMGMKIPVIWTCREDQVGDICFDVSQHPFILWNTQEELADKIVKRLKAIL